MIDFQNLHDVNWAEDCGPHDDFCSIISEDPPHPTESDSYLGFVQSCFENCELSESKTKIKNKFKYLFDFFFF